MTKIQLEPHLFRELVNDLTKTANKYHDQQMLREMISETVSKYIESDIKSPQVVENYYELWIEGIEISDRVRSSEKMIFTKNHSAKFLSLIKGKDFNDAVKNYVDSLPNLIERTYWHFIEHSNIWCYYTQRAFNNEFDARRSHG